MVPEGWSRNKLSEIAEYRRGSFPQPYGLEKWFDTNGHRFVQVYDVDHNLRLKPTTKTRISDLAANQSVFAPQGTILVTLQGSIGRVAMTQYDAYVDRTLLIIRELKIPGDSFYFAICLQELFREERKKAPGGTIKTITKAVLNNFEILWPPEAEQKKIAQILSTWDKAITATEQLLANSQQQKKALAQQLLTGKKRLPGFNGKWTTKTLGGIGKITSAGVDKKIVDGETPVRLLNFTDVFNKSFIHSNELNHWVTAPERKVKNCDIRKGDVFFTPSSETRDEAGIPAVAAEDISACCYSYHVIRFRIKERWDLNYKAYAFTTDEFRKQARRIADGSGQRYVISQDGFRGISVTYPPYDEQIAIGKVLKNAELEISTLQEQFSHLKTEKKALMQQLLTGKRRVKIEQEKIS